jgi:serine protease Do
MSNRKTTLFYSVLIGLASMAMGMVIASRLDLTPGSYAGALNIPAANSAPLVGPIDASTFRNIARDQSPTVVSIITHGTAQHMAVPDNLPQGFQQFFGRPPQDVPTVGAGSGFIIDKTGLILTNNHVVEDATEITVVLLGTSIDEGLPARVIGRDKLTDSALIQLTDAPKTPLPEAKFGDSDQLAPGDWVMAIGNPFGFDHTVTVGVVSAVGRVAQELRPATGRDLPMIQTDAAINKGNSGGPLLNFRGEVIGVNTAIMSDSGGNIGLGFSVPINTVRDVLPDLHKGKVVRGRIGVQIRKLPSGAEDRKALGLSPAEGGALVVIVDPRGPAGNAGMKPGDVVTSYNGQPVKDNTDLVSRVTRTAPGASVQIRILRKGQPQTLNVRIEELNLAEEDPTAAAPSAPDRPTRPTQPTPRETTAFGWTLDALTPAVTRRASVPAGRGGAMVTSVDPSGPAAQAGINRGDVILAVNYVDVSSVDDAARQLDKVPSGRSAFILIWQQGQEVLATVKKK